MPQATRRNKPVGAEVVVSEATALFSAPSGKRGDPIGSAAQLAAMREQPAPGADLLRRPGARGRVVDWHGAVCQVSGTLTVAFSRGLGADAARAVISHLRAVADDMDRALLK